MPERLSPAIADLLDQAAAFWQARGGRLTHVRGVVCRRAFAQPRPFDADALLTLAREDDRAISPASVYRVLADLVTAGLLRTVLGPRGGRHYSVVHSPAAGLGHIVCVDCRRVHPITDPCLALRETPLVRSHGFAPREISLRVEASCEQFRLTGSCDKNPPPA